MYAVQPQIKGDGRNNKHEVKGRNHLSIWTSLESGCLWMDISQSLCAPEVDEGIKTKVELRRVHESPRTHKLSTLMAFMGHSKDTTFWQANRAGLGKN